RPSPPSQPPLKQKKQKKVIRFRSFSTSRLRFPPPATHPIPKGMLIVMPKQVLFD
ncbi:hypothetical protein A2U01_0066024, partial [Trifolium medium]|nr:hypothetical protein [Trifolium medium]